MEDLVDVQTIANSYFPSPLYSWTLPERWRRRSYAYYGFWRCPRCDTHHEGYARRAHEAVHKLRRETVDSYEVTW